MRRLICLECALLLGLLLALLTIGTPAALGASPSVLITEVLTANSRTVADDQGRYADWIELHNPTTTPISLVGYTLTNDPTQPAKWSLPARHPGTGGFPGGVGFRGRPGRARRLAHELPAEPRRGLCGLVRSPGGQVVDAVTFEEQEVDVSAGAAGDGVRPMGILPNPDSLDSEYHPSTGSSRRADGGAQSGQRTPSPAP